MARIFVTGSADGLGKLAAQTLLSQGHQVVVHVRSKERLGAVKGLGEAVVGDLGDLEQTRKLAEQLNALGTMDAVIHNAGVYDSAAVLAVNVTAPYALTALMHRPKRLVYLSSGMHNGGRAVLDGMDWSGRRATGSYSDSKLFISTFAAALAMRWPGVLSNSVNPGWVPTKMGGKNAPDDLRLGHLTQEWLATSDDAEARTSGGYWHHQRRVPAHPSVTDAAFQARLLEALERATDIALP
ncbi:MAG: SDR family NAD(P)-dependent oxidoreductase [Myxococcaceae bacterium]